MLSWRTLLLNQSYEPMVVICWQRAIGLQVCRKVQVVETYDAVIRSPSTRMPVPAVARLLRYVHFRQPGVKFCRRNVFLRDGYQCQYCGRISEPRRLTFDHVRPRSKGGGTSWENIVTCCAPCNRSKGDQTPKQAGMRLLKRPAKPLWLPGGPVDLSPTRTPSEWRLYLAAA